MPDPTRSAAARAGHERRARRRRLARMLGAALRRIDRSARRADQLLEEPEAFAEWIVTIAADAATEWDEPDLVGGPVELPVTVEELQAAAAELHALPAPGADALGFLQGLEAQGDIGDEDEPGDG
jgi:hypothetical protein